MPLIFVIKDAILNVDSQDNDTLILESQQNGTLKGP